MIYAQAESLLSKSYEALRSQHSDRGHTYIRVHWTRYVELLTFMPTITGTTRVLEIGASILSAHIRMTYGCPVTVVHHELEPEWKERAAFCGIRSFALDLMRDSLPVEDNAFDLILFDEVFEHFPLHPAFFVKQVLRKLSPDGELLFSVPNFATSEKRQQLLIGKNPQDQMDSTYIYYAHHREPVMAECTDLITACGGQVVEKRWLDLDGDPGFVATAKRLLFHLYRGRIHPLVHQVVPSTRRYIVIRAKRKHDRPVAKQELMPPLQSSKEFCRS